MKILVDQNIKAARDLFNPHGEVIRMDGRSLRRKDLQSIDALIIRSVTLVNEELLRGTPVRFVGTTTIGTDHLDISWLEKNGVHWTSAPGCNADSAAQYTLAMIGLACERLGWNLVDLRAGIIGRGNVGSRLQALLKAIGVDTVANDPPLSEQGVTGLVSIEEALQQDIICLHVPLEHGGSHPTFHLIDQHAQAMTRPGSLLVNSARGDVIDGQAIKRALQNKQLHGAFDVWPGEPSIDTDLLMASCVATPHVAGYSDDGKFNGALQVYQDFCAWAGETERNIPVLPDGEHLLSISPGDPVLTTALETICFVREHDTAMRALARKPAAEAAIEFDRLRKNYPPRRDFRAWRPVGVNPFDTRLLQKLGFCVTA